jgi:cytochrome d ubiquinol oxidase subunit II
MIFDYATLKVIWWCIVGGIIVVFALTDGWDLGIGMLSPFLGKSDDERHSFCARSGDWEGNQTWLVIAGGVLFAAWPLVYAASFSGMYMAMLLVLFALFFRPVGFKYRNKVADLRWRRAWDWGLFIGGFVPALVFGIAFGNLLQGVPFHFDADLRAHYTGTFWQLLNPFALLAGMISVAMLAMHGAAYLCLRLDGILQARSARTARTAAIVVVVAFAAAGVWVATGIDGYRITMIPDLNGAQSTGKTVAKVPGAWPTTTAGFTGRSRTTGYLCRCVRVIASAGFAQSGVTGVMRAWPV